MRSHEISWAVAGAIVIASSNIHIHMQRSSFAGAIVRGEHVRLCAAGRESVRVVREGEASSRPLSPPPRHTAPAHIPPRLSLLVGYCAAWKGAW